MVPAHIVAAAADAAFVGPFKTFHCSVTLFCRIALFNCSVSLLAYHCQIAPLVQLQHVKMLCIVM